jgi:hypothetical protein
MRRDAKTQDGLNGRSLVREEPQLDHFNELPAGSGEWGKMIWP